MKADKVTGGRDFACGTCSSEQEGRDEKAATFGLKLKSPTLTNRAMGHPEERLIGTLRGGERLENIQMDLQELLGIASKIADQKTRISG